MADKLEMYVLAVGQGSCGLAAHYDGQGQLVQLDLCDCGRHGGRMPAEALQEQMQFIYSRMSDRAAVREGDADLYLDNVIISHKDRDHLSLLTYDYFFKDMTPAREAEKYLGNGIHERSRVFPFFQTEAVGKGPQDDEEFLILRVTYNEHSGIPDYKNASVEYSLDNEESDQFLVFRLSYQQRYSMPKGGCPTIDKALRYRSFLNYNKLPSSSDFRSFTFVHSLKTSPETGYISWKVHNCTNLTQITDALMLHLAVTQIHHPDGSHEIRADFNCHTDRYYFPEDFSLPIEPPLIPPDWDPGFLCVFDEYTQTVFTWLYEEGIAEFFPEEAHPETLRTTLLTVWELYKKSFQQMMETLEPRLPILSEINGSSICSRLFDSDRLAAPNDGFTMAVGKIYVGGTGLTGDTDIAKKATSALDTFCPYKASMVDGISQPSRNIILIQMPNEYPFKVPCKAPGRSPPPATETTIKITAEENDRSIMYIASDKDGWRAIFPGDATGITMKYFIDTFPSLQWRRIILSNTWLAAPHHGSWETCKDAGSVQAQSPLKDYLSLLSPSFIFISAGYLSQFKHPRSEFLDAASSLVSQPVPPHYLYYFDGAAGNWVSRNIQEGFYSTVSKDKNGNPCYSNLAMETGAREPSQEPVVPLPVRSYVVEQDDADLFGGTRPLRLDAFPFLFDEPPALDAFAL